MSESDRDSWARPAAADTVRAAAPEPAEEPTAESNGQTPRLKPRPLDRPAVDPETAAAFGRPEGGGRGVSGPARPALPDNSTLSAPRPAALALAFGRPSGNGIALQRPPNAGSDGAVA